MSLKFTLFFLLFLLNLSYIFSDLCTHDNEKCSKWRDCCSACCQDGKCIPDPSHLKCDVCANHACPQGYECAKQVVACFAAPCPPLPRCCKDKENQTDCI